MFRGPTHDLLMLDNGIRNSVQTTCWYGVYRQDKFFNWVRDIKRVFSIYSLTVIWSVKPVAVYLKIGKRPVYRPFPAGAIKPGVYAGFPIEVKAYSPF